MPISFLAPALVHLLNFRRLDAAFCIILPIGIYFHPMGLMAVIMFDSLWALNPILIIGSILSTSFHYTRLVLLFILLTFLFAGILILPSIFIPGFSNPIFLKSNEMSPRYEIEGYRRNQIDKKTRVNRWQSHDLTRPINPACCAKAAHYPTNSKASTPHKKHHPP